MSLYLDASVIVPLFIAEPRSLEADTALKNEALIVSDFAAAELSAVIGRRYRQGTITTAHAYEMFLNFDAWASRATYRATTQAGDIEAALQLVRQLELSLRTPDAVHIALAKRLNAKLFTFDQKLVLAARLAGLETLN